MDLVRGDSMLAAEPFHRFPVDAKDIGCLYDIEIIIQYGHTLLRSCLTLSQCYSFYLVMVKGHSVRLGRYLGGLTDVWLVEHS